MNVSLKDVLLWQNDAGLIEVETSDSDDKELVVAEGIADEDEDFDKDFHSSDSEEC